MRFHPRPEKKRYEKNSSSTSIVFQIGDLGNLGVLSNLLRTKPKANSIPIAMRIVPIVNGAIRAMPNTNTSHPITASPTALEKDTPDQTMHEKEVV